ncbi:MAG: hypothetical protein ABEJ58_08165 [Halodesulfurarchaeum sp.]
MASGGVKTNILGHESTVEYSPDWAGYGIVAMRVGLGWMFFHDGVSRILASSWSASAYLAGLSVSDPFAVFWNWGGANATWIIGPMLTWGFAAVGFGLMFGAFLRPSALLGATFMLLQWSMHVTPTETLLTRHLVYILFLFGLVSLGAGRVAGLDALFENHPALRTDRSLRWLFG